MIDKNLFIQDLKQVFTVLQELKVNEKMIKELIDKYNLTEENLNLTNEELEEVKTYVDTIKDFIVQNDNTTEIGGNMEIDGKLEVNSETTFNSNVEIKAPLKTINSTEFNGTNTFNNDVNITGELYLPSSNSLIFEDGSSLCDKLYKHTVKINAFNNSNTDSIVSYLDIYSSSNENINSYQTLLNYSNQYNNLASFDYDYEDKFYPCNIVFQNDKFIVWSGTQSSFKKYEFPISDTSLTITDTIKEI